MSEKLASSQKHLLLLFLIVSLGFVIYFGYDWLFGNEDKAWRGITPGQTTVSEVVAIMGEPDNIITCEKWGWELDNPFETSFAQPIRACWFAPLIYEYNEQQVPGQGPATHQVYFRDGRVWMVIEDTFAYPFDNVIRNEEIIATYGWPSGEAWSRPYHQRHLIYCEQGVMFGINDIKAGRVYYFEPTTIFCPDEFELYLTYDPPNPIKN